MPAPVVDSVLDLVGETPVVRLRKLSPEGGAAIWGKCEHLNPGGSVKDRICLAMIEAAEAEGRLKPGDIIVEPTSGNTGIGLALVCARKGYKLVLTMPASMSLERRALLEAYGVEIVLTEPERVMEGAMEAARRIVEERNAFMPEQFSNPANPGIHRATTAPELLRAFEGQTIDAFVAAVGAGGTILKTIDGGANWILQTEPSGKNLRSVYFPQDAVTGYAVGEGGTILKTTDGGTNWVLQSEPSGKNLKSIHFPQNATTGYAVEDGGTS